MDGPAQLHSRSLDRGTSAASSDAGDERRDSGGSTGAAASALRQQLTELAEANQKLTAAIQEKDSLIEQLQAPLLHLWRPVSQSITRRQLIIRS